MLTHERLTEVLYYDVETGLFLWEKQLAPTGLIGTIAGSDCNGYVSISIDCTSYYAHRLAWFYVTGQWPEKELDHINGLKDDNAFSNLRQVTRLHQVQNFHEVANRNSTGYMGIYKNGSGFAASINVNKAKVRLGTHETAELAHLVYMEAKRKYHEGWHLYGR